MVVAGAAETERLLLFCGSKFASTVCVTPHRYQQPRVSLEHLLIAHISLFALANSVLIYVLSTGLDVMSSKPYVPDRALRNKHGDVFAAVATLCWQPQLRAQEGPAAVEQLPSATSSSPDRTAGLAGSHHRAPPPPLPPSLLRGFSSAANRDQDEKVCCRLVSCRSQFGSFTQSPDECLSSSGLAAEWPVCVNRK